MTYTSTTGQTHTIPAWVGPAEMDTWTAYADASDRCTAAFTTEDRPAITARAWTHPRTGETRYYLDSDDIAAAAGIGHRTVAGEDATDMDVIRARQAADSKIWITEDGELHYQLHHKAEGTWAADAVLDAIRTARIVKTRPEARQARRDSSRSTYHGRPAHYRTLEAMTGLPSHVPAGSFECHFCGLDRRTCDCH